MHSLISFHPITKPQILASLSNNHSPVPPPPPRTNPQPPQQMLTSTAAEENHIQQKRKLVQKRKRKRPSVAEIERAIGAGPFKDRDTSNRKSEKNKTLFDKLLSISIGETEGKVEKKLRETGEWIIDRTEKAPKSTGRNILVAVFVGFLPLWMLSLLVAVGVVKLPFSSPFLDDLIM